jgi:hypothetical protein
MTPLPANAPAASLSARLRLAAREAAATLKRPGFQPARWCTFRFLKLAHYSVPVDSLTQLTRSGEIYKASHGYNTQ